MKRTNLVPIAAIAVMIAFAGCNNKDDNATANSNASSSTPATADTTASTPPATADTTTATTPPATTATAPATQGVPPIKKAQGKEITTKDGLKYQDIVIGKGASPKAGQTVTVNYVGMLTDGTVFDASANHGGTFDFPIGQGQVIKGWDEGVLTMKIGGKRRLTIPGDLAYGSAGSPPSIPPDATLVFDVDLIAAK